jgi:hypothetical protein
MIFNIVNNTFLFLCSKYEYAMYMLKKMGRISEIEIQQISKNFDLMPHDDDDDKCR